MHLTRDFSLRFSVQKSNEKKYEKLTQKLFEQEASECSSYLYAFFICYAAQIELEINVYFRTTLFTHGHSSQEYNICFNTEILTKKYVSMFNQEIKSVSEFQFEIEI